MTENEIATVIIECAILIHRTLEPGLLESVYEAVLAYELTKRGLTVERQVSVPIRWGDVFLPESFRADLIINRKVVIEIKAVEQLAGVHARQLLTYLRLLDLRLGLLLNFGARFMKDGIQRVANGL